MTKSATVSFLGPLGTYTHQAAYENFQDTVIYCEKSSIPDVVESLATHDFGVIPRENSIFGSVIESFDSLRELQEVFIRGEVTLKIQHCLVVRKGAKLSDIKLVMSHEQALGQCRRFLAKHLPNASSVKMTSTAAAAEAISVSQSTDIAAICSKICVTMFDNLHVLHEGIQDERSNYTRFFVLAKDNLTLPPLYPNCPTQALVRISFEAPLTAAKGCQKRMDLTTLLAIIEISVVRIDRRPAPLTRPFCDIYFLELERSTTSSDTHDAWSQEVDDSLTRVRGAGFGAKILGIW